MADTIDMSAVDDLIFQKAGSVGQRQMTDAEQQELLDLIAMLTSDGDIPESKMEGIEQKISQASAASALGTLTAPSDGQPWQPADATDLETVSKMQDPWQDVDESLLETRGDSWVEEARATVDGAVSGMFTGAFSALDSIVGSRDVHPSYMFYVMLGPNPLGNFQAVEGIGKTHEPFEYYEGGQKNPHLLYGTQSKWTDVTLKWGLITNPGLYSWLSGLQVGQRMKRNVTIMHLDRDRVPLRIYFLTGCMPTGWSAPPLSSADSNVSLESLTVRAQDCWLFPNLLR